VNCTEFDDPRYDTQPGRWEAREYINNRLNEILGSNSCAHWLARLEEQRIPCSAVNSFSQALSDPQVLHRNMVVELRHPDGRSTKGPGNPIKLSRSSEESFSAAPLLGSDTDSVMSELLGLSATDIQTLRSQGVIG
jgi:crotonobetainyl-CoA:carnitine CoA-transferase CaiB-like acyl-CoA transferase